MKSTRSVPGKSTKELERSGIPTAMVGAMPFIGIAANVSRVVRGVKIQHVFGDPKLPEQADRALSMRIVRTALKAMQTDVDEPTLFEVPEQGAEDWVVEPVGV